MLNDNGRPRRLQEIKRASEPPSGAISHARRESARRRDSARGRRTATDDRRDAEHLLRNDGDDAGGQRKPRTLFLPAEQLIESRRL
jgi:hypothetical protein